jgi:hypothetical protein
VVDVQGAGEASLVDELGQGERPGLVGRALPGVVAGTLQASLLPPSASRQNRAR